MLNSEENRVRVGLDWGVACSLCMDKCIHGKCLDLEQDMVTMMREGHLDYQCQDCISFLEEGEGENSVEEEIEYQRYYISIMRRALERD
jgi:SMC interacting uncharacterized protein involved in chromosome segregation